MLNKMTDFIEKLNNINFTKEGNDTISNDDWKVTYRTKLHSSMHSGMFPPIQIVIYVTYQGQVAQTWGCDGDEDQRLFVDWFLKERSAIREDVWQDEKLKRNMGEHLFKQL